MGISYSSIWKMLKFALIIGLVAASALAQVKIFFNVKVWNYLPMKIKVFSEKY